MFRVSDYRTRMRVSSTSGGGSARVWGWFLAVLLGFGLCVARSSAAPDAGATGAPPQAAQAEPPAVSVEERLQRFKEKTRTVNSMRLVPIEGTIELGLASFFQRSLMEADANTVVVLVVKSFGGRVDAAVRIRDAILATQAPTLVYVDRRAISAGALISLAADLIVMSPGASIGAATPVQQGSGQEMEAAGEKVVSYMRAEMRSTAEANGRPGLIAEAMVDADIEVPGVSPKGKLLTLTDQRAVEVGVAEAFAPTLEAALTQFELDQLPRQQFEINWAERLARFFTDPVVSSLLMTLGFIGLLMELYTPGFGVGGFIGITCLLLFFGGHYVAQLAGWEELLLVAFGLLLLALEVFVIPGFGVVGVMGLAALFAGLMMTLVSVDLPLGVARELGYVQESLSRAVIQLAAVFVGVGIAGVVLAKRLPESRLARWLVFNPRSDGETTGLGAEEPGSSLLLRTELLGKRGTTRSVLRPSGVVEIDGERIHVITDGEYIEPDRPVEVISVEGHRIVVRQV